MTNVNQKVIRLALFTVMALPVLVTDGQDPHFSNFSTVTQLYNPAMTGQFEQTVKGTLLHRKQWRSIGSGYRTNGMDAQYKLLSYFSDSYTGFGLFVLQDEAGIAQMKTFQVMGSAAYHLVANDKNLLSSGVQVGYIQRSIDFNGLAWDAQYNGTTYDPARDDRERFLSEKRGTVDVALGVNWKHKGKKRYSLGYAVRHAGQQTTYLARGDDKMKFRQTWTGQWNKKYKYFDLRYDACVQRQAGAQEIIVGLVGFYRLGGDSRYTNVKTSNVITGGVYYRYKDALHPFIGFEFRRVASFTFGYDFRMSDIPGVTTSVGGPEFALNYLGSFGRKRMKVY